MNELPPLIVSQIPEEPTETFSILDDGMNEAPRGIEVRPDHVKILTEQIESGTTTHFDAGLTRLIKEISENGDKSAALRSLVNTGIVTFKSLGSKAIGVLGALEAGSLGSAYFSEKTASYLSDKLIVDASAVKSIPGVATEAVKEAAGKVAENIDPDLVEAAKETTKQMKGVFSSFFNKARDLVSGNGGEEIVNSGAEATKAIKSAVSETASQGIDSTVEGINNVVIKPAVESASDIVGWASYLPSAAIGYFLTSGIVGGAAGVIQEKRQENSFSFFTDLINQVNTFDIDKNPEVFEDDPRVKLIVEFKRISESPDKTKYHFTKQEWLQFAAATREAKCSLLRSKTRAPQIILAEEQPALDRKARAIEGIIFNTQSKLAEADRELATKILIQFDDRMTTEMEPLEKEVALENTFSRKILKYSKTFVKSGINATGLPFLWKGLKTSVKVASKIILPI